VLDEVVDETPGEIVLVPRIGRREDRDPHALRLLRRKEGGAAIGPAWPQTRVAKG
jgi:hypothetical protein